jgi:hypothetical protein
MKPMKISILALAVLLNSGLALAQHGHGTGGNIGAASHGNMKAGSKSAPQIKTVSDQLSKNSTLASKLQTLTGMPAQQACSGFKNVGQCVAAAHVSKNLDISFACMKADMTGQAPAQGSSCPAGSGSKSMSLGKSIRTLSPNANGKLETKKAEKQADEDIKNSNNS